MINLLFGLIFNFTTGHISNNKTLKEIFAGFESINSDE